MKRFTSAYDDVSVTSRTEVVDAHQHLWSEGFIEQLRKRNAPPRVDGWTLHLTGEPPTLIDPHDHDLARRRGLDQAAGVDLAILSLSSPLGIESMDPDVATPLLNTWNRTAEELETNQVSGYGIWAAAHLQHPDLDHLARTLRHPRVHGLQVPATAMDSPRSLERIAPVLAIAEEADRPVLVHPGPAPREADTAGTPGWWPALASYTAQLATAWFAWHVAGRTLLPGLRIAFVALAGLAPLHHERLLQRGGRLEQIDPLLFYESSSYGHRALDAMTRVVGVDPMVHGSDRPYAVPTEPEMGAAFAQALFVTNPAHLLRGSTP